MVGDGSVRKSGRGSTRGIAAGLIAVIAIATALVLQGMPLGSVTPSTAPSISPGSSIPAATSTPAGSAEPSGGTSDQWTAVTLPPLAVAAELRPATEDATGVPADVSFALASRTPEPARAMSTHLEVTPAAKFAVADGPDATTVTLRPTSPLTAGETYRFALRAADGSVAGSWAFHVRGPVNVTTTIPGDATTRVPINTGIEVTFDQDGVAAMADHFSIVPAVTGRFERHGRSQVFVPTALKPSTLYTVTVRKGLARTGTDLVMGRDVVFRFETDGRNPTSARLAFDRDVLEASPRETPVVAVRAIIPYDDSGQPVAKAPTKASVRVYRLPALDRAETVLSDFLAAPRWTEFGNPRIPTAGLGLVTSFTAPLQALRNDRILLRFPARLPVGRYVVELRGTRPAYAFLQVTRVSAWVSVLKDRSVVWVNDVVAAGAIRGATVGVGSALPFATSDARGVAIGKTPAELVPPSLAATAAQRSPILRVKSGPDVLLVAFRQPSQGGYVDEWSTWEQADDTYWALLSTDRHVYRRTDQISVWGYLRGRDDGRVPDTVQIRLVRAGSEDPSTPAIATSSVRPAADGSFAVSLPMSDVAFGAYSLQAVVDGRVAVATWLEVSILRKPAYSLSIATNHTAVITGTKVTWTVIAKFFDGTAAPGLGLTWTDDAGTGRATTNAEGKVVLTRTVTTNHSTENMESYSLSVQPTGPESAEIQASESVEAFPAALQITGDGTLVGNRLQVTANIHAVDLAKAERALDAGQWPDDVAGRPVPRRAVWADIVELVPVRTKIGNDYDPISKTVQPVYDYRFERRPVRTVNVTSTTTGRITLNVTIPDARGSYEAILMAYDGASRLVKRTIYVSAAQPVDQDMSTSFVPMNAPTTGVYGIGDPVVLRLTERGRVGRMAASDRYLYVVAQRGLQTATVSADSTFRRTFAAADAPGVFVMGVHFTGSTYTPNAMEWIIFNHHEREIDVAVSTDKATYRPGDTARLTIRTTGGNGKPVAASVIVQAVDQKLYEMGAANTHDTLGELYRPVASGILRVTSTHLAPGVWLGGRGDTTGGGGAFRADFRDTLLFRRVETGADGRATIETKLSDDLTSWHVAAMAVTADLRAGVAEKLIPVGLPFFAEVTVADSYLVTDKPSVQLRAYGSSLRAGDGIRYQVTTTGAGGSATTVTARGVAFKAVTVRLPALVAGTSRLTVEATADRQDAKGKPLHDALVRTFEVVQSRLTTLQTASSLVKNGLPATPNGADRLSWTFADAGRGRVLPTLINLSNPSGLRLDRSLAQSLARGLLIKTFGRDEGTLPPDGFDPGRYRLGTVMDPSGVKVTSAGLGLVPTGGLDPWLAARVALLAPTAFDRTTLRDVLIAVGDVPDVKRDLEIAALAGRAGLGDPVLDALRTARAQPDLTPSELVYLALGFDAAGDHATAVAIERDLLRTHGEQLGQWIRVRFGKTADGADANALLAVVAAGVGDPLAANLAAYAEANPPTDTLNALELVAYAGRWIENSAAGSASFAFTVDGKRTVVDLAPGESHTISLTARQSLGLKVENLRGSVLATVEGRVPASAAAIKKHPALTLTRTVPSSPIRSDRLVTVDLQVKLSTTAPDGCYEVVEQVPSGLAPLSIGRLDMTSDRVIWPDSVLGQEVRFCVAHGPKSAHVAQLRYVARVVGEGAYRWEPAIMQLPQAPELVTITPAKTVTIGR